MASQPLKWHGGKFYLASWIIENMPPHLHYVEPYFGGGAVLFRKPQRDWMVNCPHCGKNDQIEAMFDYEDTGELTHGCLRCRQAGAAYQLVACYRGCSEIVNDINGELMNFWLVLSDYRTFAEFHGRLQTTPFSEELFKAAMAGSAPEFKGVITCDPIERARIFFIRYRQSRQGLGKDFATLSRTRTRRKMNEQVSSWLSAVEGLPEAHERLKRVVILNRDALDVIKKEDGEKTLFYLDPPYLHETRSSSGEYGDHEMSRQGHAKLLLAIMGIKGKFMLSGYHSELYDNHARQNGWRREEKQIDNKASSKSTKEIKTECLWMNY